MEATALLTSKDTCAVIPYALNKDLFPQDFLSDAYHDLLRDGVLDEVLHEQPMTEGQFVEFLGGNDALLSVFVDVATNKYMGVAWISELAETPTLVRGWGAFAFFRKYWDPSLTGMLGRLFLEQVFEFYQLDLLMGLTPKPNRLARAYCSRLGLRYVANVPGFTTYHGKTVDALICMMTKEDWLRSKGKEG
jgi:hypothetical protein